MFVDVVVNAISIVLGVAATHIYYRRSTRDMRETLSKLPNEVVEKLEAERRRQLTIDELEDLVMEVGYMTPAGIVPAKCPSCGESRIRTYGVPNYDGDYEMVTECEYCGWGR